MVYYRSPAIAGGAEPKAGSAKLLHSRCRAEALNLAELAWENMSNKFTNGELDNEPAVGRVFVA
jgi:hypothetical protein